MEREILRWRLSEEGLPRDGVYSPTPAQSRKVKPQGE
jgi:hypothetical protein